MVLNRRLNALDFGHSKSVSATMPSRRRVLEDAILIALVDRFETALDLSIRTDAIDHLEVVTRLCEEARTLSSAGRLLLSPGG